MCVERFVRISESPLLTPADYNWPIGHDTIMFPCVVDVGDKIASPLARYYLYLAAHGGKGIVLALADEPTGPWRMHRDNPVYPLEMAVECRGHISSPDVIWVPERRRFYLYYHGPNSSNGKGQHTGMAISRDGLDFVPWKVNPIIPNGPEGSWTSAMAAYLRVFRIGGKFYGIYMGHRGEKIGKVPISCQLLAWSEEGLNWRTDPETVILAPDPAAGDFGRIRHVGVLACGDMVWIFYSTYDSPLLDREVIRVARVTFGPEGPGRLERLGTCLVPNGGWEGRELRDPFPLLVDDRLYLYYIGGGEKGLGLAVADWPL